ncbi:4-phosphoerythronate dehydrogenase [Alloalcanivorax balearicus]|nr:4-phosphoerythronate dehydrogenase [Alloalcanivorax balearicus]
MTPIRIVADENMPGLAPFEALGTVRRVDGRRLTRIDLADTEVLLVRSVTRVDRVLLEGTPVRFVGSATIGTDHVDRAALKAMGVAFAHAPGCNARAVAEYVLQALLLACREQGRTLRDSSVGIVGLGNVGSRVAQWLSALGVTVLACDPPLQRAGADTVVPLTDLDTVLAADLVTLHVPLTRQGPDATFHMLDRERLLRLGPRQTLLSTCRGAVIDNQALRERLADANAPLVLLDVWEGEPRIDAGLLARVRLGSPHVAGYSVEGKWLGTTMLHQAFRLWRGESAGVPVMDGERPIQEHPVADEDDLLALLQRAYRIDDDDRRLRASVDETDPGRAFDALRRDYPPRHELHHWRHRGEVAPALSALLSLLFDPPGAGSAMPAPALDRP